MVKEEVMLVTAAHPWPWPMAPGPGSMGVGPITYRTISVISNSKMSSDNHPDSPLEYCELVTQVKLLLSFEV